MLQDDQCLRRWVRIQCSAQYAVPKKRVTDRHVEREFKDFITAFTFQIEMDQISEPVLGLIGRNLHDSMSDCDANSGIPLFFLLLFLI
jgi:hypothetical protein